MIIQQADWQEVNMTSFHDQTLRFTYNDLVNAFGEPTASGDKSCCIWELRINNVPFTIYDWKEPLNPEDFPDHYFAWHIGSHEPLSLDNLVQIRTFVESKI